MASFNHLRFENNGKKGKIEVKFSFDKDDSNANCDMSEVSRYHGTRENANSHGQFTSGGYERGRSRNSPTQDGSESDYETDIESLYADTKAGLNGYRALKSDAAKLITRFMSKHNRKVKNKYLHKKSDGYRRKYQKEITKFFNKNKITKTIPKSIMKGPVHYFAYGLGSHFDREHSDPPLIPRDQMRNESNRFQSFHNYKGNGNPWSLSSDGFYHDHTVGDSTTRCVACPLIYSTWTQNDDVSSVHRRLSPECTYVNRNGYVAPENVVMQSVTCRSNTSRRHSEHSPNHNPTASRVSEAQEYINIANTKLTREYGNQERPTEVASLQNRNQVPGRSNQSNAGANRMFNLQEFGYERLGLNSRESVTQPSPGIPLISRHVRSTSDWIPVLIEHTPSTSVGALHIRSSIDVPVNNPKHPDKCSLDARMHTYLEWSGTDTNAPTHFSEAGFFYAGFADAVRCFCCSGGLRNWGPEDDPWEEHARWFPDCEYIRAIKGEGYVVEVQTCNSKNTTEDQGQHNGRADMTNDTVTLEVVNAMHAMGISADNARDAVLGVRHQTGVFHVTLAEAMNWYLDNERSLQYASTVEAVPSQAIETSNLQSSRACASSSTRPAADNPKAENQRLKEAITCKICMDRPVVITFLPCGHLLCCETCAVQIKQCPTCGEKIMGTVKTFLPL